MKQLRFWLPVGSYLLALIAYSIFSFSLTAPNLVFTTWEPFWRFQTYMWETFFNNRTLLTQAYLALLIVLGITYLSLLKLLKTNRAFMQLSTPKLGIFFVLLTIPLLFANNALSYDVFNYMFNARMILKYGANPHNVVALEFAYDPWVRFMHNTHTPAPYGYGWTVLSLVPYLLGGGKFITTWFSFKAFAFLSYVGLYGVVRLVARRWHWELNNVQLASLFLNPLLCIEILGNLHNDLWMMIPALGALGVLATKNNQPLSLYRAVLAVFLLSLSISIKFASVALVPVMLLLMAHAWLEHELGRYVLRWWPLAASLVLFMPLLTSRSKFFLPWYLTWSLVWLPLLFALVKAHKSTLLAKITHAWSVVLLSTSGFALTRYVPYLWTGEFTANVTERQLLVVWVPMMVVLLSLVVGWRWWNQHVNL